MGTRRDTPPDRGISKNGHDQSQDRKIDALRDELKKFRDEDFKEFAQQDLQSHDKLGGLIHKIETQFTAAIERLDGKINAQRLVALAAWAIFALVASWAVSRAGTVFDDLAEKVHLIDSRTQADWANGRKWGEALDKDVERLDKQHHNDMDRVNRQIGRLRRGKPLQEESE